MTERANVSIENLLLTPPNTIEKGLAIARGLLGSIAESVFPSGERVDSMAVELYLSHELRAEDPVASAISGIFDGVLMVAQARDRNVIIATTISDCARRFPHVPSQAIHSAVYAHNMVEGTIAAINSSGGADSFQLDRDGIDAFLDRIRTRFGTLVKKDILANPAG